MYLSHHALECVNYWEYHASNKFSKRLREESCLSEISQRCMSPSAASMTQRVQHLWIGILTRTPLLLIACAELDCIRMQTAISQTEQLD